MNRNDHSLHVTFVCTGNICRSPMAANVFTEYLRREGLDGRVRVSSSGTGDWHVGSPADPRTAETLRAAGYPVDHVAAQIGADHLDADLLIAMDARHRSVLHRLLGSTERVRMLRSFAPEGTDLEVPDPYIGGQQGFTDVLEMVHAAMPGLLQWVRERV